MDETATDAITTVAASFKYEAEEDRLEECHDGGRRRLSLLISSNPEVVEAVTAPMYLAMAVDRIKDDMDLELEQRRCQKVEDDKDDLPEATLDDVVTARLVQPTLYHRLRLFYEHEYRIQMLRKALRMAMDKEELEVIWSTIAHDGSDSIDRDELGILVRSAGVDAMLLELDELFESIDRHHTKLLHMDEFRRWLSDDKDEKLDAFRRDDPEDHCNNRELLLRESARLDDTVMTCLDGLWTLIGGKHHGFITREEYMDLHAKLYVALDGLQEAHPSCHIQRKRIGYREWEFDARGADVMDKTCFRRAFFQLVDAWHDVDDFGDKEHSEVHILSCVRFLCFLTDRLADWSDPKKKTSVRPRWEVDPLGWMIGLRNNADARARSVKDGAKKASVLGGGSTSDILAKLFNNHQKEEPPPAMPKRSKSATFIGRLNGTLNNDTASSLQRKRSKVDITESERDIYRRFSNVEDRPPLLRACTTGDNLINPMDVFDQRFFDATTDSTYPIDHNSFMSHLKSDENQRDDSDETSPKLRPASSGGKDPKYSPPISTLTLDPKPAPIPAPAVKPRKKSALRDLLYPKTSTSIPSPKPKGRTGRRRSSFVDNIRNVVRLATGRSD